MEVLEYGGFFGGGSGHRTLDHANLLAATVVAFGKLCSTPQREISCCRSLVSGFVATSLFFPVCPVVPPFVSWKLMRKQQCMSMNLIYS